MKSKGRRDVTVSEQTDLKPPPGEQDSPAHLVPEEYPGVRYQHIPDGLRREVDRRVEGMAKEKVASIKEVFRKAFGTGGEDAVRELLGLHEEPEPQPLPQLIKELYAAVRATIAGVRRSPPLRPSVRHEAWEWILPRWRVC
jgi:hypothetical protein